MLGKNVFTIGLLIANVWAATAIAGPGRLSDEEVKLEMEVIAAQDPLATVVILPATSISCGEEAGQEYLRLHNEIWKHKWFRDGMVQKISDPEERQAWLQAWMRQDRNLKLSFQSLIAPDGVCRFEISRTITQNANSIRHAVFGIGFGIRIGPFAFSTTMFSNGTASFGASAGAGPVVIGGAINTDGTKVGGIGVQVPLPSLLN